MLGHIEMKASFKTTNLYGTSKYGQNFKEWPTGIQINKWTVEEMQNSRIEKVEWWFDNSNDLNLLKSLKCAHFRSISRTDCKLAPSQLSIGSI